MKNPRFPDDTVAALVAVLAKLKPLQRRRDAILAAATEQGLDADELLAAAEAKLAASNRPRRDAGDPCDFAGTPLGAFVDAGRT